MSPVKRTVILICSMILISFTLADFGMAGQDLSHIQNMEETEEMEQTISEHGKNPLHAPDTTHGETGMLWRMIKGGRESLARSAVLFFACFFAFGFYILRISPLWCYLRFYRFHVFDLARFLCELITQKKKDGKKRIPIGRYSLLSN